MAKCQYFPKLGGRNMNVHFSIISFCILQIVHYYRKEIAKIKKIVKCPYYNVKCKTKLIFIDCVKE